MGPFRGFVRAIADAGVVGTFSALGAHLAEWPVFKVSAVTGLPGLSALLLDKPIRGLIEFRTGTSW